MTSSTPHDDAVTQQEATSQPDTPTADATESRPARPSVSEQEKLQNAIPNTSYKDLPTLLVLQTRLAALMSEESRADDPALQALASTVAERIAQHHDWQASMVSEVEKSQATLQQLLTDGRLREAQSLWDRNQNTLKKLTEAEQLRLQELLAPLKAELTKLLDWKKFAASEKKRELIEKMRALTTDESAPAAKAKLIRELQDEWKLLGHSDDNDELWLQFSELGKTAFEPCKVYFKERKEKQAANLIARTNICEQLEAYVATLADKPEQAIDLQEAVKLEQQARTDWKKFAPVAQNKIKSLQQRFNNVLNALKQQKRSALQLHNAQKQALIDQAKALVEEADLAAAINQAKKLQADWKALGPGSYQDDRKLWTEFRGACDALFARRDQVSREQRNQGNKAENEARKIIGQLNALMALDDEQFADARAQYNDLSKAFRAALSPDMKAQRKNLQDQFNKLARRFDARMKTLPDRKTMQLMQLITARAEYCQKLEAKLLSKKAVTETADEITAQWQAFDSVGDPALGNLLEQRLQQLLAHVAAAPDDGKTIKAAALQQADAMRLLCVDAEIMCGVDSPASDKALRMQQQLNQLQKGLGRMPATQKERLENVQQAEMQLICSGPLTEMDRASFSERLQRVRQRA
ncbi:DUF349 domain-containing protein [Pseudohongiella sp. O18]|uniref:DUF349 domain-containing protein n=1 Tax=Pseudohongiella sp. O18 TaxID=2904248 RepID=UPI001F3D4F83|nr:DUF349 domain-containing protein [Pseudohongiella sp. O18]